MDKGLSKENKTKVNKVISCKSKKEELEEPIKSAFKNIEKNINNYLNKYLYYNSSEIISKKEFINKIKEENKGISKIEIDIIMLFYDNETNAKLSYDKNNKKIDKLSYELKKLVKNCELKHDHNIVLLNKKNADKIKEEINKDDYYIPFARILYNHYTNNNKAIDEFINNNKERVKDPIFIVMREIDRDNNTNVWRYKDKRGNFIKIYEYIKDKNNKFFEELKAKKQDLPDKLTEISDIGIKSLSSKICKYLCEYIYDEDGYFINDKYIRHALPFYLEYYQIEFPKIINKEGKKVTIESSKDCDKLTYKDLFDSLNKLLTKVNEKVKEEDKITKNELDSIIWYSYKSFKL